MQIERQKNFLIQFAFWIVVLGLFFLCFKYVIPLAMPLFIGFLIAVLLHPVTQFLCGHSRCSQKFCSMILLTLFYAIISLAGWFLVTGFLGEFSAFLSNLPTFYQQDILPVLEKCNVFFSQFFRHFPEEVTEQISTLFSGVNSMFSSFLSGISQKLLTGITSFLSGLPGFIVAATFAVMSSFFFLFDYTDIMSFLSRQIPKKFRSILFEAKHHFLGAVRDYFKAYLILFILTFIQLFIGFWIVGIKYAATASFLISFVDFLPVFGTGAVLVPWIFLEAARGNLTLAVGLTVIFLVTGAIRNVIEPKIIGDRVGLHPLITLAAIYIGGKLFGLLGIFAVPFTIIILKNLHDSGKIHLYKEKGDVTAK